MTRGFLLAGVSLLLAAPAHAGGHEDPQAVLAAMRAAVTPGLPAGAAVTYGSAAGARFMPDCPAPLSVSLSGIAPYQNAAVRCPAPNWTLYVPVTVAVTEPVVVAARPVAAGQTLSPSDLAIQPEPQQAYASQQVFYDTQAVTGGVALVNLATGMIVTASDVAAPVVVKAGQTVSVDVQSGGVEVSINAVAQQAGRVGDTILLTNPSSGKRFSALVTADGPVVTLQP